jgi:hypothetical protein
MDPWLMMGLAAAVAACKCSALGASPNWLHISLDELAAGQLQMGKQGTAVMMERSILKGCHTKLVLK